MSSAKHEHSVHSIEARYYAVHITNQLKRPSVCVEAIYSSDALGRETGSEMVV